jgi:hypothetical protein
MLYFVLLEKKIIGAQDLITLIGVILICAAIVYRKKSSTSQKNKKIKDDSEKDKFKKANDYDKVIIDEIIEKYKLPNRAYAMMMKKSVENLQSDEKIEYFMNSRLSTVLKFGVKNSGVFCITNFRVLFSAIQLEGEGAYIGNFILNSSGGPNFLSIYFQDIVDIALTSGLGNDVLKISTSNSISYFNNFSKFVKVDENNQILNLDDSGNIKFALNLLNQKVHQLKTNRK